MYRNHIYKSLLLVLLSVIQANGQAITSLSGIYGTSSKLANTVTYGNVSYLADTYCNYWALDTTSTTSRPVRIYTIGNTVTCNTGAVAAGKVFNGTRFVLGANRKSAGQFNLVALNQTSSFPLAAWGYTDTTTKTVTGLTNTLYCTWGEQNWLLGSLRYSTVLVAGNGTQASWGIPGNASEATLNLPQGVTISPNGTRIVVFSASGVYLYNSTTNYISWPISSSTTISFGAFWDDDTLVYQDATSRKIVKYSMSTNYTTDFAGSGNNNATCNGLDCFVGIAKSFTLNPVDGCMYFIDSTVYVIRKMYPNGTIVDVSGTRNIQGLGGNSNIAGSLVLNGTAQGMAFDRLGNLYFGDKTMVRRIDYLDGITVNSTVSFVVGGGLSNTAFSKTYLSNAYFSTISDIKFDSTGIMYVLDSGYITLVNVTGNWTARLQDVDAYVNGMNAGQMAIDENNVIWVTSSTSNKFFKIVPSLAPQRIGVWVCAYTASSKANILFSYDANSWYTETVSPGAMVQCKYSAAWDKFMCVGTSSVFVLFSRGDVLVNNNGVNAPTSVATDDVSKIVIAANGNTGYQYENGVVTAVNNMFSNGNKYIAYFNGYWFAIASAGASLYVTTNLTATSWTSISLAGFTGNPLWNSLEPVAGVGVMLAGGDDNGPAVYVARIISGNLTSSSMMVLAGQNLTTNFTISQGNLGTVNYVWYLNGNVVGGNVSSFNRVWNLADNGKTLMCTASNPFSNFNASTVLNVVGINGMNNVVFGGDQMVGGQLIVQTSWNRSVSVYGNASIVMGGGLAWYSGGNGTSGLNFTYNVVNGDWDLFLGSVMSINGTLKDEHGFEVNQTYVFGTEQSLQVFTTTSSATSTTESTTIITSVSLETTSESQITSTSEITSTATISNIPSSQSFSSETSSISSSISLETSSTDAQTSSSSFSVSSTSSITSSSSLETTSVLSSEITSFSMSTLESTETSIISSISSSTSLETTSSSLIVSSSVETTSVPTSSIDAQTSTSLETTSSVSLSSTEITSSPSTSSSVISSGLSTNSLSSSSQTSFVSLSSSSFSQSSSLSSVTTKSLSSSSVPTSTSSVSSSVTTSHSLSIDANSLSTVSSSITSSTFKSLSVAPSTSISSSKVVSSSSIQMSSSSGVSTKALISGVSTTSIVSGSSISSTQNIGTTSKFVSTIPPTKSSTIPFTIISTSILKTSTASVVVASGVDPSLVANATPLTIPASDVVQVSPTPATNVPGLTFTPQVVVEIPIQTSNGKIVALQVDGLTFSSQETGLKVGLINGLWNKVNHDLYQMGTSVSLANNGLTGNVYIWLSNVKAGSVVTVNSDLKVWTEIGGRKRATTVGWIKARYVVKVVAKVGSSSIKNSSTKKSSLKSSLKSSSSTTTRKISTTGKITSTAKVSAYKTTTTTTTTRRTDIIVAEYCAPGKKYHNSLNCCCAPAKTITRTRTMQGKSGSVETGVVVFDRQVAFDHLCPVKCPSRPKTNGKPVLCCMPRVTKTVTKTKFI